MRKQIFRRIPLRSVSFSDMRGEIRGFADLWFFWVHEAFKDALDIRFVERIDREKTTGLLERTSLEQTGLPFAELRRRTKESAESKQKCRKVLKAPRKMSLETEATSPTYTFQVSDSFESRCGGWYIQVTSENSEKIVGTGDDTEISHEELGVVVYRRSADSGACWEKYTTAVFRQSDFARLLRTGSAGTVNLTTYEGGVMPAAQMHSS